MTELFPDIAVFYDDDPVIPVLTRVRDPAATHSGRDDIPETIQDFARPPRLNNAADADARRQKKNFAWLICCSTVFLIDMETKQLWTSPDESLLPLASIFLTSDILGPEEQMMQHTSSSGSSHMQQRRPTVDMSSAHGHVTLL
jgi:hypothetical protein